MTTYLFLVHFTISEAIYRLALGYHGTASPNEKYKLEEITKAVSVAVSVGTVIEPRFERPKNRGSISGRRK
jgi:hypothetical protein